MPVSFKSTRLSSITVRLVITYFIVMILTLILVSYYILNSMIGYMYREQKMNVTTMANVVSSFAPEYISADGDVMDARFNNFVKSIVGDAKMRVLILNRDSVVIFDSQNNHNVINKAQINPSVLTAVGGKPGYCEYYNDDKIMMLDAAAPIMRYGTVSGVVNVVYTTEEVAAFRSAAKNDIALLTFIVSLLVGIIIFIVANLMSIVFVSI